MPHHPAALLPLLLLPPLFSMYAAGTDEVASTPPMGWNSWNHYHCAVNEAILRNMSKLYQTTGVAAAGYQYVNIDDCWQAQFRDKDGHLQAGDHLPP